MKRDPERASAWAVASSRATRASPRSATLAAHLSRSASSSAQAAARPRSALCSAYATLQIRLKERTLARAHAKVASSSSVFFQEREERESLLSRIGLGSREDVDESAVGSRLGRGDLRGLGVGVGVGRASLGLRLGSRLRATHLPRALEKKNLFDFFFGGKLGDRAFARVYL